ncbi:hypothetical protein FOZG_18365 [Fusarium oxysporum Fo47]|uniref:Uncharacterized protein n=1 Tax=Fusarium oxysporum Fo47 TaxID=660027 RepID=W9JEL7_FUSOX|nr:hypothetical protein FOZG_18530 [Fusarium oxysporum Fo47]EWZ27923.1 hypothetical protein FOZG_18365 [Fusarium oxysporum Fo47]
MNDNRKVSPLSGDREPLGVVARAAFKWSRSDRGRASALHLAENR